MPLVFLRGKFHPEILVGPPERGRQTREGGENQPFSDFKRQYLENGKRYVQSYYLVTNRKSYMGFRWTPRSMTLDDLELL